MKKVSAILLSLLYLIPFSIKANICDDENLQIMYGNGMFNSEVVAEDSRDILQEFIFKDCKDLRLRDLGLSYNQNEGGDMKLADAYEIGVQLNESYDQVKQDKWSTFWRWVSKTEVAPHWFNETLAGFMTQYSVDSQYVQDEDLRSHIANYTSLIEDGEKVLVVAHSQGNFYANLSREYLKNTMGMTGNYLGIVSVATPASYVSGLDEGFFIEFNQPYTTLTDDVVITDLVDIITEPLSGNVTNNNIFQSTKDTYIDTDPVHHNFIKSYLRYGSNGFDKSANNQSGPKIFYDIDRVEASLETPLSVEDRAVLSIYFGFVDILRVPYDLSKSAFDAGAFSNGFTETYSPCDSGDIRFYKNNSYGLDYSPNDPEPVFDEGDSISAYYNSCKKNNFFGQNLNTPGGSDGAFVSGIYSGIAGIDGLKSLNIFISQHRLTGFTPYPGLYYGSDLSLMGIGENSLSISLSGNDSGIIWSGGDGSVHLSVNILNASVGLYGNGGLSLNGTARFNSTSFSVHPASGNNRYGSYGVTSVLVSDSEAIDLLVDNNDMLLSGSFILTGSYLDNNGAYRDVQYLLSKANERVVIEKKIKDLSGEYILDNRKTFSPQDIIDHWLGASNFENKMEL